MSMLARGLRRARAEDGVTLVELVVVISIMSVVLGFVSRTFIVFENASQGENLRLQNLDEARTLMDDVSKDIRTAARISPTTSPFDVTACTATGQVQPCAPAGWASGNAAPYAANQEMWFYANLTLTENTQATACPDIIHLFVDTSVSPPILREQVVSDANPGTDAPPNCVYGTLSSGAYTATYATRIVGKYIANATSNCPSSSQVFTYWYDDGTGTPTAFLSTDTPLSAANRIQVNAVAIAFSVRQQTNYTVPCTTLLNRVRLANVEYNPIPSPSP
jgi:prepilin-type N-terminal cleavage/methylation domain-containing protein